jgi:hypothetical protein
LLLNSDPFGSSACYTPDWEWIDKVPKIRLHPEFQHRIRFLTFEQANMLLQRLPDHQEAMACLD